MIKFNIFFEPIQKFNERVKKLNTYVAFNESIINWTKDSTIIDLIEPLSGREICIFRKKKEKTHTLVCRSGKEKRVELYSA